ncbi:MAG: hypothetical protein PUH29_03020 [Lachnospiraceae bacterium]|nr:hypothetical protein [Lachnospiraceae bacterium]MDY5497258.1 hypothetical protein [Anaerobutyricum sp.]
MEERLLFYAMIQLRKSYPRYPQDAVDFVDNLCTRDETFFLL